MTRSQHQSSAPPTNHEFTAKMTTRWALDKKPYNSRLKIELVPVCSPATEAEALQQEICQLKRTNKMLQFNNDRLKNILEWPETLEWSETDDESFASCATGCGSMWVSVTNMLDYGGRVCNSHQHAICVICVEESTAFGDALVCMGCPVQEAVHYFPRPYAVEKSITRSFFRSTNDDLMSTDSDDETTFGMD